jgi:hypothetical protein
VFPSDLLEYKPSGNSSSTSTKFTSASSGFYTHIQFQKYDAARGSPVATGTTSYSGIASPQSGQGVYLPLPRKIVDEQIAIWDDSSYWDYLPTLMSRAIRPVNDTARLAGQTLNPFLYMLYKQPAFRMFELNWVLSANSPEESTTLRDILTYFKAAELPEIGTSGLTLDYPYLAYLQFNPNEFMFDLKPCAIVRVGVDYTGSATGPSFYKDGAPTIISLSALFKETEIMLRRDIVNTRGNNLTSGMTSTSAINNLGSSLDTVGQSAGNLARSFGYGD